MLLRSSVAFGLTSLGLLLACSDGGGPGGTGGAGPGVGGGTGVGGGNTGVGGGNTGVGGGNTGVGGGNTGVGGGNTGVGGTGVGGSNVGVGGGNTGVGGGNTGVGGGADVDANGRMNDSAGTTLTDPQAYLRMGEIRILNNNWGSEDLGCNAPMSIFINQDSSFGWTFNRPACGGQGSKPDFPQIEFGIHPFGIGNHLVTSPDFTSTTLLPKRISEINSASVSVEGLNIALQSQQSWNITFEFWLSDVDPALPTAEGRNHNAYAELMTFWGWQAGRWPEDGPGQNGAFDGGSVSGPDQVSSGGKSYTLWVQRDNWADGWRYYQFRDNSGPQTSFNGTIDVKPFLDYLVNNRGFPSDLWVTRLEVGSEIDDNTAGTVSMQGITFEVNGMSRSEVIAP